MKILNTLPLVALAFSVLLGSVTVFADDDRSQMSKEQRKAKHEERLTERCGQDADCRERATAKHQERKARHKKRIDEKCLGDEACEKEMHKKMKERKATIDAECGSDKDCRKNARKTMRDDHKANKESRQSKVVN